MDFKQVFNCLMMFLKNINKFSFEILPVVTQRNFSGLFRTTKESTKSRSLETKMRPYFSQTSRISSSVDRFFWGRESVCITSKPNPERTLKSPVGNWASSRNFKDLLSECFCNQIILQRTEGRPGYHQELNLDNRQEFQIGTYQMPAILKSWQLGIAFP